MRHALSRAAGSAALAFAVAAAPSALAQEAPPAPPQFGQTTGYNLLPATLSLLEATRAGVAFEAVPDTRFRIVRHTATGYRCIFLPASEAVVTVVAASEGAGAADDSVCLEQMDDTVLAYRITRRPGATLDEVFADARTAAGGWIASETTEAPAAPTLLTSPYHPNLELDMPRREVLLVGANEQVPAVLRIAVVDLGEDWWLIQNYFAPMPDVDGEQAVALAQLGSALAEASLVVSLGEMLEPTRDPMLP